MNKATQIPTMTSSEVETCRRQADAFLASVFRNPRDPAPVAAAPVVNRPAPAAARELALA